RPTSSSRRSSRRSATSPGSAGRTSTSCGRGSSRCCCTTWPTSPRRSWRRTSGGPAGRGGRRGGRPGGGRGRRPHPRHPRRGRWGGGGAGAGTSNAGGLAADTPTPSAGAMADERAERMRQALATLPEDYRNVIVWRYQEEQSFAEIAQRMGRGESAVRKLWFRAIERLEQEIGESVDGS